MPKHYKSHDGSGPNFGKMVGFTLVWFFMFIVILPPIMGCADVGCASVPNTSLLLLWWDVMTLFNAVPYMAMVFGIWSFIFILLSIGEF